MPPVSKTRHQQPRRQRSRLRFETLESRDLLAFDVPFDGASPLFNLDGIANYGSTGADLGDPIDGGTSLLITNSYGRSISVLKGNGLPDDGFFPSGPFHPEIQLGYSNADNGNNVAQLFATESFSTNAVAGLNFSELHLLSTTGSGNMDISVQLDYQDGGSTTLQSTVPDWFESIADGTQAGDAARYTLIDDMDRVDLIYDDANAAAVFGNVFPVDPARPLASIAVTAVQGTAAATRLNVLGMTLVESLDFGDIATGSYPTTISQDGARHVATGPRLGETVTTESEARLSSACCPADDASGDEDDGIVFRTGGTLTPGTSEELRVLLRNADSSSNRLDAWFDWNGDGDFTSNEQVFDSLDLGTVNGDQVLSFNVPSNAVLGASFARFRISTSGNLNPDGLAADGEVEDYAIYIRSDGAHFTSLVGIDFDDPTIGDVPANWTQISTFDPGGSTFGGLLAENGFSSPYSLHLSSTLESAAPFTLGFTNAAPQHANPLEGLDGIISSGADSQAGDIFAEWTGLRPGAEYEIYVFGLEGDLFLNALNITISSDPPQVFQQFLTDNELRINSQKANGAPLESHAVIAVADANGAISIAVEQAGGSDAIAIAGLAIRQIAYPGPQVIATSIGDGETHQYSGNFTFDATINSTLMAAVSASDFQLVGAVHGPQPAVAVSTTVLNGASTYSVQFGVVPDDNYTLTLLSGDGRFEDSLGADLDGNTDGDGLPGGDHRISFATQRNATWHNSAFPEDVTADTLLNVSDLRTIFSYFLAVGTVVLDPIGPPTSSLLVDVNDDGVFSISDIRLVFSGIIAGKVQGEGESAESEPVPIDFDDDDRDWDVWQRASEDDWWLARFE